MTIRLYIAIFYGLAAATLGMLSLQQTAHAEPKSQVQTLEWSDLDRSVTGHPEQDDLPAYLAITSDTPEFHSRGVPMQQASLAHTDTVLTPDGLGGLRWSVLINLTLFALVCLAIVFTGGRRHVAR